MLATGQMALKIAEEAGYVSTTYSSKDIGKVNSPQTDPFRVKRMWIHGIPYNGIKYRLSGPLMLQDMRLTNLYHEVRYRWAKK